MSDSTSSSRQMPKPAIHMQESKPVGKLSELWASTLEGSSMGQADVSTALSELLASKDAADIQKAKKAAFLAASVMQKHAVPKLESRSTSPELIGPN